VLILYHATGQEAGLKILAAKQMLPGSAGMYGAACYFADTPEIAMSKSINGTDMVIIVLVDLRGVLVMDGLPQDPRELNLAWFRKHYPKANVWAVKGRRAQDSPWEYPIYDHLHKIRVIGHLRQLSYGPRQMRVVIQGPSGQTCTLEVAASTTPEELKEFVQRWLAIEPGYQELYCNNRRLCDGQTMAQSGVSAGNVIQCRWVPR
jgi:hypothetical protein